MVHLVQVEVPALGERRAVQQQPVELHQLAAAARAHGVDHCLGFFQVRGNERDAGHGGSSSSEAADGSG